MFTVYREMSGNWKKEWLEEPINLLLAIKGLVPEDNEH